MGRKKIHTDETKALLLETAETLLAKGGVKDLSARKLAGEIGVTTRAIYSVFDDMDGVINQLVAKGYTVLGDNLRAVPITDDPIHDLELIGIDGFRAFALNHPNLYRLTFEHVPANALDQDAVKLAMKDSYDVLMGFIIRAQKCGIGANMPKSNLVISFHAVCQGLAAVELSHQAPPVGTNFWQPLTGKDPVEIWRTAIRAMLTGLK